MSEPLTREDYLVTLNLFARSTQEERDHGPLRADLIAHVDALRQQLATARLLATRFADWMNALDNGCVADGVTNNTAVREQLATARREVWLEAAKYWDAPDWHALAERYPADEYPKWSDSFAAWCRQQAEAVKP